MHRKVEVIWHENKQERLCSEPVQFFKNMNKYELFSRLRKRIASTLILLACVWIPLDSNVWGKILCSANPCILAYPNTDLYLWWIGYFCYSPSQYARFIFSFIKMHPTMLDCVAWKLEVFGYNRKACRRNKQGPKKRCNYLFCLPPRSDIQRVEATQKQHWDRIWIWHPMRGKEHDTHQQDTMREMILNINKQI